MAFHHRSLPDAVVAAAIGQRRGFERQGVGRDDAGWLWRLKLPGQDGEDHVAIVYSSFQSLGARGFDGIRSMVENAAQHFDELTIAVVVPLQPGPGLAPHMAADPTP